jgi:peptidoglycan/xylan/chitin deacetylase (PgdA/CDA1 family)
MADVVQFGKGRSVLLTFDDGPEPASALDQILNLLAQNQIVGEFYVIGTEVKSKPDKARAIVRRGHKIQNHSWSHIDLEKASEAAVRQQVQQTQQIVYQTTGVTPTKLRPPYGNGGWPRKPDPEVFKVAHEFSLKVENWDVDTRDWAAPQGIGPHKIDDIRRQLAQRTGSSSIILMHVQPATARDLPSFITTLKGWGFAFARP